MPNKHHSSPPVTEDEFRAILEACRRLPPAKGMYILNDYVENVLLTVLDFQMHTVAVERAASHYLSNRREEIRTFEDLKRLLSRFPDNKEGNTEIAQHLWGYSLWTRVELLRRLVGYFEAEGVTTQEALKAWAEGTDFGAFAGKVKGAGFAIFKWLVMRQGVETVKPDLWVRRFVHRAIGRNLSDQDLVTVLEQAAHEMGIKAYELDWRIWESERSRPALL